MRLGLVTPVLTLNPRAHNAWEEDAAFDAVVAIAEAADRLGWHHITCSEHVAVPASVAPTRGSRYWDPLATFGYVAARTQNLRLATHVLVLGYHHPLEIAKRYGTLDRVSGGRLILGVGVGSLKEEFDLLGVPFEGRGGQGDEAIRAVRASLSTTNPRPYEDFIVDPCAVQERVPIWIGGRTARSLRRAVELGDAWVPFGIPLAEEVQMLERARDSDAWQRREQPLEIVLYAEALDPLGDPDRARGAIERRAEAGADAVNVRMVHRDLSHCLEQLEAMIDIAG